MGSEQLQAGASALSTLLLTPQQLARDSRKGCRNGCWERG